MSLFSASRGQRAGEDEFVGGDLVQTERVAERQLVLRQRAGLVGAQHVDAGQFLDRDELADDRLFLGEQASADRHRHRQDRGHRDGNGGHGQDEGELQRGEHRRRRDRFQAPMITATRMRRG